MENNSRFTVLWIYFFTIWTENNRKHTKDEVIKERYKWLLDIADINNSIDSFQEKEWELRKLSDKINEFQVALSEANMDLISERKKILNYIHEIESYRRKLFNKFIINIKIWIFLNYYLFS